jgi:hypothetical protein
VSTGKTTFRVATQVFYRRYVGESPQAGMVAGHSFGWGPKPRRRERRSTFGPRRLYPGRWTAPFGAAWSWLAVTQVPILEARHFQYIAHRGACGKPRVVLHNRRPSQNPRNGES